jgi:hypothetical protein
MATTYDGLRAEIADWLNRADLAAVVPTFIALAESYFDKAIRTREMLTTASVTATDGSAPLPANMAELLTVRSLTRDNLKLEFASPREAIEVESVDRSRPLAFYTIVGASLRLVPRMTGTEEVQLDYYARIPKLGASQPSNWLLVRAPEIYLYGALVQASPYLKDDARVSTWADLLQRALDDLRIDNERAEYGGSTLKIRAPGFGV